MRRVLKMKGIIKSVLLFVVVVSVDQVAAQRPTTSSSSFLKHDSRESAENAFWKLQNSGGTNEANLRKSVGDHLEISYDLLNGPVKFVFDKNSRFKGTLTIIAHENVKITSDDLTKIHTELENLLQLQTDDMLQNKRIGFAVKTLEYLAVAQPGYVIQSRTIPFQVNKRNKNNNDDIRRLEEPEEDFEDRHLRQFEEEEREERMLQDETQVPTSSPTHNCSDSFLSTWADIPHENASCPTYTARQAGDSGANCLCPYDGQVPKEALYEVNNPLFNNTPTNISWVVKYGLASPNCLGRCGFTCNRFDKEAYQDCLNHDVCLTHVGGSPLFDNPQCGQEWGWAADDYIASFGFGCCDDDDDDSDSDSDDDEDDDD